MILDSLAHRSRYVLPQGFVRALEWLASGEHQSCPLGRNDIDGDSVYAMVAEYATQPEGKLEAHRRYADVQFVARGSERLSWRPREGLETLEAYDAEKDIEFFHGQGSLVELSEGCFCILWPEEAHAPGLQNGPPSQVRKVVVKVLLEG